MNDSTQDPSAMTTPEQWRARGVELPLPEGRIFMIDIPPVSATTAIPLLILHGFPSSSWDFAEAVKRLRRRVVLFDFLGFGLSDKPEDAGYSLFEQADIAIAVLRRAGLDKVHVWAHDMGTSVATELLARRERDLLPFEMASLTLMNGSVHIEMASLTVGQHILKRPVIGDVFARLARERVFDTQMKRIFARPPPPGAISAMWSFLTRADGHLRLPKTIRYVEERARFERRWIGALERLTNLPVLVAWGVKDPVAVVAIADRLARDTPSAESIRWDDLGHYPQVEDPDRVGADVERFLARVEGGLRPSPAVTIR